MKIRAGFVSNSSSSSFVVILPDNFIETLDLTAFSKHERDAIIRALVKLIEDKQMFQDDLYGYDVDEMVEYIYKILEPYTVASISTSSSNGQIVVLDKDEVRKLL